MEAGKEGGQMIDLSVIVHSLALQGRRQEAQPGSSSFIPGKDLSLAMSTNQSSHTTPNPGPVTLRTIFSVSTSSKRLQTFLLPFPSWPSLSPFP